MGIVETVINNDNPGVLQPADLAITRSRNIHRFARFIAAMTSAAWARPPPAPSRSANYSVLLEPYDLATLGPNDPESWRLIGDASRLAFADRGRYMADSDFVPMPPRGSSTGPTWTSGQSCSIPARR